MLAGVYQHQQSMSINGDRHHTSATKPAFSFATAWDFVGTYQLAMCRLWLMSCVGSTITICCLSLQHMSPIGECICLPLHWDLPTIWHCVRGLELQLHCHIVEIWCDGSQEHATIHSSCSSMVWQLLDQNLKLQLCQA